MVASSSAILHPYHRLFSIWAALVAVVLFWPLHNACANPLPLAKGSTYLLPVGEHDLRQALINFGKANGISVKLSPDITGTVPGNGQLQATGDFIAAIASRSGLSWFSFRDTVYFSRTLDSIEASVSVKATQQAPLRLALINIKLLDERFAWTELPAQNQILIYGPRTYVQLVRQQASRLQPLPPSTLGKSVTETPEAMVFKLKYASAIDKPLSSNGATMLRPGIASILNSLYKTSDRPYASFRPTGPSPLADRAAPSGNLATAYSDAGTQQSTRGDIKVPAIMAIASLGGTEPDRQEVRPPPRMPTLSMGNLDRELTSIPGSSFDAASRSDLPSSRVGGAFDALLVIEADQRTNSIIIRDRPSRRPEYERLIATLDVPIQQIELETILIDMQEEDIAKSLGKLPSRTSIDNRTRKSFIVLNRETADALLAYAKAVSRRGKAGLSDLTVLSQTVVFKQDESFNLDFSDDHVYPDLSAPIWKRLAAEVVTTATQPEPKIRSTALKITGTASFNDGKIELQAAIEESRNRPDLPSKTIDRRHTGLQMSVGLAEGDVCVLSNTSYFTGSEMNNSRGRLVLLSARRYGNSIN
ncbi:MAG: EscC/YscC/HrcC family type secretion system outer rane ring protein [Rhizobacter sp.]|nr:EscC/YscC/HrcC family type secretion system outer rane ring protein [Rhizobacter sp.]